VCGGRRTHITITMTSPGTSPRTVSKFLHNSPKLLRQALGVNNKQTGVGGCGGSRRSVSPVVTGCRSHSPVLNALGRSGSPVVNTTRSYHHHPGNVQIEGSMEHTVFKAGRKVEIQDVERCLRSHPAVQEVQVFGVPDPSVKEELVCWVKIKDGHMITEEEVQDFCKREIGDWMVPRFVVKVDRFPRKPCGKVEKYVMRAVMVDNVLNCGIGPCLKDFMTPCPSGKVCGIFNCSQRQYCESLQKFW